MTFADVPAGTTLFVDANILVYQFTGHAVYGPACVGLLERVFRQEVVGITSAHVLAELTHRLMSLEAAARFSWPTKGIAARMRNHPPEVQQLTEHRRALDELSQFNLAVLSVDRQDVSLAADITQQTGLLSNDAILVAVLRRHGITALASNDADFDRVPNVTRYAPV